ncbi:caspase, EACC1-associated type [Novosphingobium sp.]|uniref:caspase, EACC1-associated type n=1 Tax=Novosphingobium sp. TaxID=1874826 RepID=UPI003D6D12AD
MAGSRQALSIATGSYQDQQLRRLRAPAKDAAALARVLGDPAIGDFHVERVVDQPVGLVRLALERFFADRGLDDLLLVHVSCHGVKDDDGRLYFAASDTEREWLDSTAVSAAWLNERMDRCRARSIVLLLDCCFSGAFLRGSKGDMGVDLKEWLGGSGRAILTASNAVEYAWEGDELSGQAQPSLFTAAIVEGLETGEADRDGDGQVSIDDLYAHVYERVRESGRSQTPLKWTLDIEGKLFIARNPHPPKVQPGAFPPQAEHQNKDGGRTSPQVAGTAPKQYGSPQRGEGVAAGSSLRLIRGGAKRRWWDLSFWAQIATILGTLLTLFTIVVTILFNSRPPPPPPTPTPTPTSPSPIPPVIARIDEFAVATGSHPVGMTAGPDGNMWFTEPDHDKIGKITPDGKIAEYPVPTPGGHPFEIAAGPDGNVWFTEGNPDGTSGNKIGRLVPATGEVTEYPIPTPDSAAVGITAGPDGNMWFTEYNGNKIGKITPSGNITEFALPNGGQPNQIIKGPDNHLWFTEFSGDKIGKMTITGEVIGEYSLSTGAGPVDITVGPDGNLWFTEIKANKIGRITPTGNGLDEFAAPAESWPANIAIDSDGILWFTELRGHKIGQMSTTGADAGKVLRELPIPSAEAGPKPEPLDIATGPNRSVWFTEQNSDRIGRITR